MIGQIQKAHVPLGVRLQMSTFTGTISKISTMKATLIIRTDLVGMEPLNIAILQVGDIFGKAMPTVNTYFSNGREGTTAQKCTNLA